ncbi:hypothetical protein QTH97_32290 [Variovorax sp. J22R24]|uniref:hypothetical protein n=1 Tax=Variovorax gracilis TaxID=3053502 RepID=UPI002575B4B7|nr:hypothetical protein [Variovorax sp. J22R24]MDM0109639.1 hypothetical protein [Variovorax sp. J22R24]
MAAGTVALAIGAALLAGSFVNSRFSRRSEAKATGKGGLFGIIGAALGDATGVSGIYEAATDESVLSGTPLNRSEEERWEGGVGGGIQMVATVFGVRTAFKGKTTVTQDPPLPAGEGFTDPFGNITVSSKGSAADRALVRYHEEVHSFFSPKFRPLRNLRASIRMNGYQRSALLQYVEEALAETRAQMKVNGLKGIPEGVRFPIANGYVTLSQMVTEAAIGTVIYGGIVYGVYVLTEDDSDSSAAGSGGVRLTPAPAGGGSP